jgi:hypothetical protein
MINNDFAAQVLFFQNSHIVVVNMEDETEEYVWTRGKTMEEYFADFRGYVQSTK